MSKKIFILLTFILIIASALRFWQLGEVPSSPDWDEAALGYNAYSILQTGRDEYGDFLPIVLRSFDDYKPALYAYLTMPSISVLGLNVLAVRLPSVIFGILTVLAVFFLVKELFRKNSIALLSAGLLAISPWHIQFSRIAFESNVGVALNVFGVLFFLKSFSKHWYLFFSAIMFGLGLHVYQGEKVFVPLLLIALVVIFRKQLFTVRKRYIVISFLIFTAISLPLIHFIITNNNSLARAKDVSVFSNTSLIELNADRILLDKENNNFVGLIFDNRRIEFLKNTAAGYISHFNFNWLFITGDIARHHAPGMGLMYLIELPFLLVGVYRLVFGSFNKKAKIFIFLWFLIAPIPASITNDVPNAVRTLIFLPTFQIFTAIGILTVFGKVSSIKYQVLNIKIKHLIFLSILSVSIFNFLYYLNQYFIQQNYFHARYWQYGYENIVNYVAGVQKDYDKIIVSNTATMDQSYIFFLFYLKYDPHKYLSEGGTLTGKIEGKNKFSNFEFRKFNYDEEKEENILLVGSTFDFQEVYRTIHEVNYPDKSIAIKVVEKNK
ncbi:MAG: glycosyltransferase family 39 protein [Candidatus Levybacteria bacterium]|nr:glycosyltransferase family 39 protein [Candidatus Levybacteria bacterium]